MFSVKPFFSVVSVAAMLMLAVASCRDGGANARHGIQTTAGDLQQQLEACRKQHAAQVSTAEVEVLRAKLRRYDGVAEEEGHRRAAMRRVMDSYSRGVCLIHGVFTFHERRGVTSAPVKDAEEKPIELEYLGSGFLVSDHGHVVTNRHVAEPWWNNERVAPLLAAGLEPTFIQLTATFPDHEPLSIDAKTIRVSTESVDVAVFVVSVKGIPVLPLSDRDPRELRGERLMLLGYPTGLSALLARADPDVAHAALAEAHDTTTLIEALSRRHAITPVITHGTLSDATGRQLIYDAVTTSGGSGGPVFGPDGDVIGVNFAILRDFQGSNFGVPIRFVQPLLP
ncbi:Putative serine protease HtrA [Phycisphaerae bacterium RAS2]|nr:Putative serine protease HtrA [Phycisphaerae bacterium RAS2]